MPPEAPEPSSKPSSEQPSEHGPTSPESVRDAGADAATARPGPTGHVLWTPKGMVVLAAVIGLVALGVTMTWPGRPAPQGVEDEEGPVAVHMGAQMELAAAYAPRFNDAQAFAAPMPEGEWDGNGWLFVANEVGRGVSVYDIQTQQPVEFVYSPDSPVPHHPYISPDQRWVAADARFGNETFLIDTENDFATTFLEFPEGEDVAGPLHGTWTADSTTFLVALQRSGRLGVVDVTGDEPVIAEVIDLETRPRDVYVTPDDERAFVTMQRSNRIAVVDLGSWEVRYIDRGGAGGADYTEDGSGSGGGMSTDGSLFAVSNTLDDEVVIIDTATEEIVHRIADVPAPVNAEFLGTTHVVGTGNRSDGSVTFIDADSGELLKTVATGGGANIPYMGPDGNIWVTHNGDHHLSVLDAETYEIIDEVEVGVNPHWMFFTPYGSRAFVSNWGEASVSIVDVANRQEIGRIDTALNPNGMAIKSNVTEAQAERALERAEEEGVAEQIAAASEMILPEPRDEAEQVFLNTCTQCHDLGRIVRNNAQGEQWAAIVERMKGNGAQMTDEEQQMIVDYLIDGRHQDLEFGTRYDEEFAAQ